MPYPDRLLGITQTYWATTWDGEEYDNVMHGPLTPDEEHAFSADQTLNSTVPALPDNASETGVWFEGVPPFCSLEKESGLVKKTRTENVRKKPQLPK
ncbi:MAG: hypothetical protein ACBZ72_12250 [Candidatus Bathyarchaeia archaeon]|jgi:hypothetical protein